MNGTGPRVGANISRSGRRFPAKRTPTKQPRRGPTSACLPTAQKSRATAAAAPLITRSTPTPTAPHLDLSLITVVRAARPPSAGLSTSLPALQHRLLPPSSPSSASSSGGSREGREGTPSGSRLGSSLPSRVWYVPTYCSSLPYHTYLAVLLNFVFNFNNST